MDIAQILAISIHTLALVITLGWYGLLGRVILPALGRSLDGPALAGALHALERRAFPFVVIAAVAFTLTGSYLLVVNPQYAGPGNVLASAWTALMLAKHVLIAAGVVLALAVHRRTLRAGADPGAGAQAAVLRGLALRAEALTALGALVIVLTATAQVAR